MRYKVYVDDDELEALEDDGLGWLIRNQVKAIKKKRDNELIPLWVERGARHWSSEDLSEYVLERIDDWERNHGKETI